MNCFIKNVLSIAAVSLLLASCKKQLTEYNPSGATVESLFNTKEGIESAVNGAYAYNRSIYGKEEGVGLLEVGTDLWTSAGSDQKPELTSYQGLNADQSWVKGNMWTPCYAAINLINEAMLYIDKVSMDEGRRTVLKAELRFLRGWYYWHLTETFGSIHFTLQPTEVIVTTANKTSPDAIYQQIFEDVLFAAENLPTTSTDYGRAVKPVAEAFLARLYLTRGNNQQASNYANKVINGYSFKLLTNYSDLWSITNQKNAEVIWPMNYSTTLTYNAGSNVMHTLFLMEYNTQPGMQRDVANGYTNLRYMPTLYLIKLFNEKDDARFAGSFKQAWIANYATTLPKWTAADSIQNPTGLSGLVGKNKFSTGDTAIYVSKYVIPDFDQQYTTRYRYKTYDITDVYDTVTGKPKDRFHFFSLKKFDDPSRSSATETQSSRDVFIMRLAEMYMIAAEAQMKLGKTDSAAYFVNQVRSRAAISGHTTQMQVTAASITLDFILDERAREFAGEQMRWYDLKRTSKLIERVRSHNPDAAPYIKDFHTLRPIPQAQLDAVTNKSEFAQNPGY